MRLQRLSETALRLPSGEAALTALIAAAVAHQFRRPRLARLLDFEEARLPLDLQTRSVITGVTQVALQIVDRLLVPGHADKGVAARDVIAIMKGMIDAAGSNEEDDPVWLTSRVRRAVFGYLSLAPSEARGTRAAKGRRIR